MKKVLILLIIIGIVFSSCNITVNTVPEQEPELCQSGYLIYSFYNETTKTGDTYVSDIPVYIECQK